MAESLKMDRIILKAFLLAQLHHALCEMHENIYQPYNVEIFMESYFMDSKIIQFLIQDLVRAEEYTLEGIAYYTRLPFDVIYDAACGTSKELSITLWIRVVDLYLKTRPIMLQDILEKITKIKEEAKNEISTLLKI